MKVFLFLLLFISALIEKGTLVTVVSEPSKNSLSSY